jgi:hypothetical protein
MRYIYDTRFLMFLIRICGILEVWLVSLALHRKGTRAVSRVPLHKDRFIGDHLGKQYNNEGGMRRPQLIN